MEKSVLPRYLPFPAEAGVFKVEGNFPELRTSDTQNAIKTLTAEPGCGLRF